VASQKGRPVDRGRKWRMTGRVVLAGVSHSRQDSCRPRRNLARFSGNRTPKGVPANCNYSAPSARSHSGLPSLTATQRTFLTKSPAGRLCQECPAGSACGKSGNRLPERPRHTRSPADADEKATAPGVRLRGPLPLASEPDGPE
jgi:hypothetical protein